MILFKKPNELNKYLINKRSEPGGIGFVPTMGALHDGHLSLINASKRKAALTVCSIFINPRQFNDPADFEKYPVTLEKDIALLEAAGCDILFLPTITEIYPDHDPPLPHYELGKLELLLEGRFRPGHFQGVCQVVHQLLKIVAPTYVFLGQKDYQQCMVIERLLHLTGSTVQLEIVPTMRAVSGLALSSRNLRLTDTAKKQAATIYQALHQLKTSLKPGNTQLSIEKAIEMLQQAGFEKIDYVSIANAQTLEPVTNWDGKTALVGLVAAFLSGVRLIDNISLT